MNKKEVGGKIIAGGLSLSLLFLPGCNNNVAQANEKIPSSITGEIVPGVSSESEITIPEIEVIFKPRPIIVVEINENETIETTPVEETTATPTETTVVPTKTTAVETTVAPTETMVAPVETTTAPTEITVTPEKKASPSVIVYHGNLTKAEIAFTFDDAGAGLGKILEICNQKGIKATFFLLAGELEANPERWQKAVEDGHQICNHTVSHNMSLPKLSEEAIKKEILGWEKVAKKVLGEDYVKRMKEDFPYFRAPGGNQSKRLQQVLGDLGYPITAYWSCEDCWFLTHNPNNLTMVQHYTSSAKNGAIFLMHGGKYSLVSEIIDNVQNKGYEFKLVSEILD